MKDISKLLKQIRVENNLTQEQIAKQFNVTNKTISNYENGTRLPDLEFIKNLCNKFNISIKSFFEGNIINESNKKIYSDHFSDFLDFDFSSDYIKEIDIKFVYQEEPVYVSPVYDLFHIVNDEFVEIEHCWVDRFEGTKKVKFKFNPKLLFYNFSFYAKLCFNINIIRKNYKADMFDDNFHKHLNFRGEEDYQDYTIIKIDGEEYKFGSFKYEEYFNFSKFCKTPEAEKNTSNLDYKKEKDSIGKENDVTIKSDIYDLGKSGGNIFKLCPLLDISKYKLSFLQKIYAKINNQEYVNKIVGDGYEFVLDDDFGSDWEKYSIRNNQLELLNVKNKDRFIVTTCLISENKNCFDDFYNKSKEKFSKNNIIFSSEEKTKSGEENAYMVTTTDKEKINELVVFLRLSGCYGGKYKYGYVKYIPNEKMSIADNRKFILKVMSTWKRFNVKLKE